jgi:hypothetical protein
MDNSSPTLAHEHHAVQFYENTKSLYTTVAGFLGQGLVDGQPAILIASEVHRGQILDHVKGRLIDVDQARRNGDLVVLDAQEMLALFILDGMPDADAFEATVGRLIGDLLASRSKYTMIRAYGDMVDLLWKNGQPDAAIRLEILWNALAMKYGFALLCGYAMGNFYKETRRFEEVCRQHAHVVPADPPLVPSGPVYHTQ